MAAWRTREEASADFTAATRSPVNVAMPQRRGIADATKTTLIRPSSRDAARSGAWRVDGGREGRELTPCAPQAPCLCQLSTGSPAPRQELNPPRTLVALTPVCSMILAARLERTPDAQ